MPSFCFTSTLLDGLMRVERQRLKDTRGFLARLFCGQEFPAANCPLAIAQINHTLTRHKGTVRGMHFQKPPYAEIKLVSCVHGRVFDVAIDLRPDSPSFLQWHGEILSAENGHALYIPQGFAHGFQALDNDCELVYLHSAPYHREAEAAVNALDPRLNIDWPLPPVEMSDRDRQHPFLANDYSGIEP